MFFFAILFITNVQAQIDLDKIEINPDQNLWEELDGVKILTGKKNRITNTADLPLIQTDNNRQHFSNQPSIYSPEQVTEPWTVMNYRGFGTPQESQSLLLLQDGLPVALDMYSQLDHYYAPPMPLMEKIQVIGGGGALLYGPQPGGAVNYVTPQLFKGMNKKSKVNLAGGSYNLISTINTTIGSSGNTSYWLGYYRKQGDGLQRTNGDFYADYLQIKTKTFLISNAAFKYSFQGYNSDFGMPGGMSLRDDAGLNPWGRNNKTATRIHNRLKVSRAQMSFGFEKRISETLSLDSNLWSSAYRKYNKTQKGSGFGKTPTVDGNLINTSLSYSLNAEVRLLKKYSLSGDEHSLSFGFLTYNTSTPSVDESGAAKDSNHGTVTSRVKGSTKAQALFIENQFNLNQWRIVPGLRYENIHQYALKNDKVADIEFDRKKSHNVLLGGLGSSYDFNDQTQFYANISQGFKPTSFEDVLSQGNPNYTVSGDIKPSYSYFYETGIRSHQKKIEWDTSIYYIHRQNILASSNNVLSNGGSAEYSGLEAALTLKEVVTHLDFYINGNFLNAKYRHGEFKGNTPGHAPSLLLKSGLTYHKNEKIKSSLLATFVNEHYSDDSHTDNYKVPSYYLFDYLMDFALSKKFSMNLAVNNILDQNYYARVMPTGVMPTMGRNYYAGLSYEL